MATRLSGHAKRVSRGCPLSGVKRTCVFALQMSAYDPKRTFAMQKCTARRKRLLSCSNRSGLLKGEDALPVVLHVDYDPFIQHCGV